MEDIMISPFDADIIQKKSNSTSTLFNCFENKCDSHSTNILNGKKSSDSSEENSTKQSTKSAKSENNKINSLIKKLPKVYSFEASDIRKDIYGNIIEKGGKHKVSFKDDIKGQLLVEMTLVDINDKSFRSKNYKNYTIYREARDKEGIICSGLCNIF